VIELEELKERRKRIEEHGRVLEERLAEIEVQRADRERELRLLRGLEEFCASVRDALEEPSFETKQRVLRLVVDRIVVEESKIVVHHVVPTGPVRLQTESLTIRTSPYPSQMNRTGSGNGLSASGPMPQGSQERGGIPPGAMTTCVYAHEKRVIPGGRRAD
jgi:hypothetical protein